MSVSLAPKDDPEVFDIVNSDDSSVQKGVPLAKTLPASGAAEWKWRVTPRKSGNQVLVVKGFMTIPLPGLGLPPVNIYQKEQVITVPVEPLYKRLWSSAVPLLSDHSSELLKWSWTVILFPLFAWVWKAIKKRRQRADKYPMLFGPD
jgi:hypothetical protein